MSRSALSVQWSSSSSQSRSVACDPFKKLETYIVVYVLHDVRKQLSWINEGFSCPPQVECYVELRSQGAVELVEVAGIERGLRRGGSSKNREGIVQQCCLSLVPKFQVIYQSHCNSSDPSTAKFTACTTIERAVSVFLKSTCSTENVQNGPHRSPRFTLIHSRNCEPC